MRGERSVEPLHVSFAISTRCSLHLSRDMNLSVPYSLHVLYSSVFVRCGRGFTGRGDSETWFDSILGR